MSFSRREQIRMCQCVFFCHTWLKLFAKRRFITAQKGVPPTFFIAIPFYIWMQVPWTILREPSWELRCGNLSNQELSVISEWLKRKLLLEFNYAQLSQLLPDTACSVTLMSTYTMVDSNTAVLCSLIVIPPKIVSQLLSRKMKVLNWI